MNRQISLEQQQIGLFEPPLTQTGVATAPLIAVPRYFEIDTCAQDDAVFSEISLSGRAQQCLQLIAPILRELSEDHNDRWLTLISPPKYMSAQWLRDAGLNRERILVLRPRGIQSSPELASEALRLGCSHTVISWFNPLPRAIRARLTAAARIGAAQSLNIRQAFTL